MVKCRQAIEGKLMKLAELKERTYRQWEFFHSVNRAVIQPKDFKAEIRQYGDLRRKSTWVKALCYFEALNINYCCLDAYELITIQLNLFPGDEMYPYRHQLFEEFLATPDALEMLKTGFEQLFSSDFTQEEREEAHGFFAMVEEQSAGRRIEREPARLAGRIAELAGATTS